MSSEAFLFAGGAQAPVWALRETLASLGLEDALASGRITLERDGSVEVKSSRRERLFSGSIQDRRDIDRLMGAVARAFPKDPASKRIKAHPDQVHAIFDSLRGTHVENRVNNRWFRDQDFDNTQLLPKYRGGRAFDLPLIELPKSRVDILRVGRKLPELDLIEAFFDRGGHRVFPVHPQEIGAYEKKETITQAGAIRDVRCASSDRTLHTLLPGTSEFLLKVPLPTLVHDDIIRPISADAAFASKAITEFLMDWVDNQAPPHDPFCFLPEPMAIVDKEADSACIVRLLTPYPPPPGGKKTWIFPAYSLYAKDRDFPSDPPLAIWMTKNRSNQDESEADYFLRSFIGPMVKSVLRVAIDLGSSHVPHGQNLFVEMGEDGQPTGRVAHADLESFWPHPDLARPGHRPDYYQKYGLTYSESSFEAQVWGTFRVYFLEALLSPVLDSFKEHFPKQAPDLFAKTERLLRDELLLRRHKLDKHFDRPGLRSFHRLMTGELPLSRLLFWRYDDECSPEALSNTADNRMASARSPNTRRRPDAASPRSVTAPSRRARRSLV